MNNVFITGTYRSGSTLLQKLISAHESAAVFPQPCAPLFFHAKRKFYSHYGMQRQHPIDPSFPEASFGWEDLNNFLETEKFTQQDISDIFDQIRNYDGIHTPEVRDLGNKIKEGSFLSIYLQMISLLNSNNKSHAGSKEILCEEFTPCFLRNGIKCIIIIRDPRDMICSLNFGKGAEYTGEIRPLLYSLRLWRKSIAFSIFNARSSDFMMIRYEDLVTDQSVIRKVFTFLGLDAEVNMSLDESWKGNSSFAELSTVSGSSVGNYKKMLDERTLLYIETVCRPEMSWAGYYPVNDRLHAEFIRSYREPFKVSHRNFNADYSSDPVNIMEEILRIKLLREKKTIREEEQRSFFLFPEVYCQLKENF